MIAVQKSCIHVHAPAVAVFVEWWIVVFVDNVSFHRGICTLGASFLLCVYYRELSVMSVITRGQVCAEQCWLDFYVNGDSPTE